MTNKLKIVTCLLGVLLLNSGYATASENVVEWLLNFNRMKEVKPVSNKAYQTECSDCHFAYQPGLLPAKSWEKLLTADALRKHFGINAEIEAGTLKEIHDYAIDNAADKSYYKRSRKIANATANGDAPLRIIELRYIERKHKHIPEKMVKGNAGVKSLSFCDKCHTEAAQGVFDNDTVSIPNYPDYRD
jgi:Dihaem cytochrome c